MLTLEAASRVAEAYAEQRKDRREILSMIDPLWEEKQDRRWSNYLRVTGVALHAEVWP